MNKAEAKKEEISKAIDAVIDEQLGTEGSKEKTDEVAKAMPVAMDENGGKDKIKSGSPFSEGNKKSPENEGSHSEEAGKEKSKVKKSEETSPEAEEVEKAKAEKKDEEKNEKDDDKDDKKKKMMKSYEEVGELTSEEIELVKAWRAESQEEEKEEVQKSMGAESLTKAISEAVSSALEPMKKALEAKDEQIETLKKSVEKLSSQPAYDKRSLSTLETIEKGGEETPTISKSQILEKMLDLQMQGKGVKSQHVAEFEATNNISNPEIKQLVMGSFKQ